MVERRNTGAGFFTDLGVDRARAAPAPLPRVIGSVWAWIEGLTNPVSVLVFVAEGRITTLEGAALDDTTGLDLGRARFRLES